MISLLALACSKLTQIKSNIASTADFQLLFLSTMVTKENSKPKEIYHIVSWHIR